MKRIHTQEKEQFKSLFKQENIDRFEDRYKILEVFLQTERHITIDELLDLLAQNGLRYDILFIKDTLKRMCEFGFARENSFDNGRVRYEHRHLGQHHDHMVCTKCGTILEFENHQLENLQVQIAAASGFHILQHKMEIYGICNSCFKDRVDHMPLAAAKPGDRLTISEFTGGAGSRMRLMSMGLRVKDELEVISNLNRGQVVIALENKRYVLGKGLAGKILVTRVTGKVHDPSNPAGPEEVVSMPLSEISEGQSATILRVGGNGALRRRLLEMGLVKGSDVYVEKYAPLKDPVELVVKGYHVSLRVEEAAQITVYDVL